LVVSLVFCAILTIFAKVQLLLLDTAV